MGRTGLSPVFGGPPQETPGRYPALIGRLNLPEKALSSYFHAIPSRQSSKRHQDKQDKRPIRSSTDLTEYFSDQDRPPDKRKRYTQTSILDSLILKNYFIYPFIPTHPGIPKMPLRPWPVTAQLKLGLSSHCLRVVKCVLVILVIIIVSYRIEIVV